MNSDSPAYAPAPFRKAIDEIVVAFKNDLLDQEGAVRLVMTEDIVVRWKTHPANSKRKVPA